MNYIATCQSRRSAETGCRWPRRGPGPAGGAGDVDVLQTYARGPESQVNSIIWPNVEFGCDITVYGPEVKAFVKRYLEQMIEELQTLPHPDGEAGTLVDAIDLVIPHQANKRMVIDFAEQAGIGPAPKASPDSSRPFLVRSGRRRWIHDQGNSGGPSARPHVARRLCPGRRSRLDEGRADAGDPARATPPA